jgi:hypothetical protein
VRELAKNLGTKSLSETDRKVSENGSRIVGTLANFPDIAKNT